MHTTPAYLSYMRRMTTINKLHLDPRRGYDKILTSRTVVLSQGIVPYVPDYTIKAMRPEIQLDIQRKQYENICAALADRAFPEMPAMYHMMCFPYRNCTPMKALTLRLTQLDARILRDLYA